MHRNIFFRDSKKVPVAPFSAIDSLHPEDLWTWMDGQRKMGNELLAISHNANLSNGIMFPVSIDSKGKPLTAAWAQERLANEPVSGNPPTQGHVGDNARTFTRRRVCRLRVDELPNRRGRQHIQPARQLLA